MKVATGCNGTLAFLAMGAPLLALIVGFWLKPSKAGSLSTAIDPSRIPGSLNYHLPGYIAHQWRVYPRRPVFSAAIPASQGQQPIEQCTVRPELGGGAGKTHGALL